MEIRKKRIINPFFYAVAFFIAIIHLGYGIKALFVFRNNEPILSLLILIFGPLSTLPALLVGLFWKRFGAIWVLFGSIISFSLVILSLLPKRILGIGNYFVMFSGPMLLIGFILLYLSRKDP
jgi:hypothetical protein